MLTLNYKYTFKLFDYKVKLKTMIKTTTVSCAFLLLTIGISSCEKTPNPTTAHSTQSSQGKVFEIPSLEVKHGLPPVPDSLWFAGEKIPLQKQSVRERLERELIVQTNMHSRTLYMLCKLNRWEKLIKAELEASALSEDFFYLAVAESELNNNITSPARAVGMWQFLKATAKEEGLIVNDQIDERRDPVLATHAAASYLKKAKEQFGSWVMAAASYNRGVNGMKTAIAKQKVQNYFDLYLNEETARYVYRIMAMKIIYSNPEKFGFEVPEDERYDEFSFKLQDVPKGTYNTVDLAKKYGLTYAVLKEYNPWMVDVHNYQLVLKKTRKIRLPA